MKPNLSGVKIAGFLILLLSFCLSSTYSFSILQRSQPALLDAKTGDFMFPDTCFLRTKTVIQGQPDVHPDDFEERFRQLVWGALRVSVSA